jgi:hypothetical protein
MVTFVSLLILDTKKGEEINISITANNLVDIVSSGNNTTFSGDFWLPLMKEKEKKI